MPKPLTYTQAVKLANEAVDKEIQRLAVDANLYLKYGGPAYGKHYAEKREKLHKTKAILEIMLKSVRERSNDAQRPIRRTQIKALC